MADKSEKTTPCQHCGKGLRAGWKSCPYCTMPVILEDERVTGIILVKADRNKVSDIGAEIASYRTVEDAYTVSGDVDILLKISAKSFGELREFSVDSISSVKGVQDTRTHMIVTTFKEKGKRPGEKTATSWQGGKDPVRTVLFLRVDQTKKEGLCKKLSDLAFIEDVFIVTGDWDIIIKGVYPSYGAMKRFVGETVGQLDGVREQKTLMAMELLKEHGKMHPEAAKRTIEQPKEINIHLPKDEQEIFSVLTNLPRGLPSALWGMDMEKLVDEILKAEYGLATTGYPVLKLKNKWFFGDIDDPSTYLQPYDGQVLSPGG